MSQIRLYEYIFQMWRIDPYVLCIRTFNHIWNMYLYNRIWDIPVIWNNLVFYKKLKAFSWYKGRLTITDFYVMDENAFKPYCK
jgi:hypothetical protein